MQPWADFIEPWMCDDDAAWWAKVRNANRHRTALAASVADFNKSEPFTLTQEGTDDPEEVAYRVHIHRTVPADISTGIGDVVHNLASALDSVAYALARQTVGRELTRREERATTFPICRDPESFVQFFEARGKDKKPARAHLFDDRARAALQVAQPFYWPSQASGTPDDERDRRYRETYEWSSLKRLRDLNKIDKHRRLATLHVGWPDIFWFSSGEDETYRARWGTLPIRDNEIMYYLSGPRAAEIRPVMEFSTLLTDDPKSIPGPETAPRDFLDLLTSMAEEVSQSVFSVLSEYGHRGVP